MRDRLNNVTLRQLRAVEEVARHRSFVEAASYLHLTSSALSESVKSLETSLGVRLFDRTTRSVQPTAAGHEFIEIVRGALGQLDRAVEVVGELQNLERGLVRCVGATSALACLVAPCLAALWKRAPQVRVEMRTSVAWEVVNTLRSGEADFCLGTLTNEVVDDIDYQPLVCDRLGLVAERNHPAVRGDQVDLRLVQGVPYVALTTLTMIDKLLARQKDIPPEFLQPAVRVDGTGSLAAVLQQGTAVGILPAMAMHHMGLSDLKFCPLVQEFPERTVGMFRLKGRSLTPAAQALWDLVRHQATQLDGIQGIRITRAEAS
jgi:DNA-binding transcriptional LysR family regulator